MQFHVLTPQPIGDNILTFDLTGSFWPAAHNSCLFAFLIEEHEVYL